MVLVWKVEIGFSSCPVMEVFLSCSNYHRSSLENVNNIYFERPIDIVVLANECVKISKLLIAEETCRGIIRLLYSQSGDSAGC